MRRLPRVQEDPGQGVFELVVVVGLIVLLLAVATPAYLSLQSRRADKAAQAALVEAARGADSYRWTHGSYARMSNIDIVRETPDLSTAVTVAWARKSRYCLSASVGGKTWSLRGPYKGDPRFSAGENCS